MNKDNLRKATEAMRSGKYPQTQGYLHDDKGFCALGVICDVSGMGQWERRHTLGVDTPDYFMYNDGEDTQAAGLPTGVMQWLGIGHEFDDDDDIELVDEDGQHTTVVTLNDDHEYNLDRIAALLEKRYEL